MAFSDLEGHTLSVEVRGTRKKAGTYKPGINTQLSSEGELSHGARTQTADHGSVSLVLGVPGEGVPVPLSPEWIRKAQFLLPHFPFIVTASVPF